VTEEILHLVSGRAAAQVTEEILHLVSGRAAALVAQDWAAVDAQLHPRFVYTNSRGKRLARAAYVDFLSRGPLRWRRQWMEEGAVVDVGDTAVLHGVVVDDVLISDAPQLLRFATTQTYVRVGGRWSYLTGHTAPIDDQ
jgi:hypothetical protein